MLEPYIEPWKNHPYLITNKNSLDWKGTPGVGDILFGLNSAHMCVHLVRKKRPVEQMTLNVHWTHDRDFLYHFEDPETIIERCDYLHNFYYDKDSVKINHIFNSNDEGIMKLRHRGFQRASGPLKVLDGIPSWIYRPSLWLNKPVDEKKVVFWRPLFNAEPPQGWKRQFSTKDWEKTIDILESKGFRMQELTYRTPVSEALYHIRTCRFCIFYDGMWQYIARNMCKPVISVGNSNILKTHSPQGVTFKRPNDPNNSYYDYLSKFPRILEHMDRRANKYRDFMLGELNI